MASWFVPLALLQVVFAVREHFENEAAGVGETLRGNIMEYPSTGGFISRNNISGSTSAWGCDNYSAAVYVITKNAIALSKDVADYLLQNQTMQTDKISPETSGKRMQKLKIIRRGVDLYANLLLFLKVLWHDSTRALTMLGQQFSMEMNTHCSKLHSNLNLNILEHRVRN